MQILRNKLFYPYRHENYSDIESKTCKQCDQETKPFQ